MRSRTGKASNKRMVTRLTAVLGQKLVHTLDSAADAPKLQCWFLYHSNGLET